MFIVYVLFLLLSIQGNQLKHFAQQQSFTQSATAFSQARSDLASTSSGELVFFAGGYNSAGPSDRVDIYNVTSGSWTTSTLSIPRRSLAATSSQNLVFFGGGSGSIVSNQVDIYNKLNGSWSTATLSQSRRDLAATSVRNLVLFGGGRSPSYSNVVDVFDVTSNTWTNTTLSQARSFLAATSVDNRYALFGGGLNGSGLSNVVDIFDSLSGMWNTTTLSQARRYLASTSLGNLAFFGGGLTNGGQPSNVVDIFNSTSQTWSTSTLSQARSYLAASSIGEIVAFRGGWNGSSHLSVVDLLNVTNGFWFTETLSQFCSHIKSTSSTNKIFFGGGQNIKGYSDVVDIFEISLPPSSSISEPNQSIPPQSNVLSPYSDSLILGVLVSVSVVIVLLTVGIVVVILLRNKRKKKTNIQNGNQNSDQNTQYKTIKVENVTQMNDHDQTVENKNTNETQTLQSKPTNSSFLVRRRSLKSSFLISFNELTIEKEIGRGKYGRVCLGKWKNLQVALKFCREKDSIEEFMREAKIMTELSPHPNVVRIFGVSIDGPQPIIVLEYCAGGSLDVVLFDKHQQMTYEEILKLIRGIAAGMCHLHKRNIVHRDLAARNILLTSEGDPKISDFGMSRILQHDIEAQTHNPVGPVRWMAPESIGKQKYSKKSDVWTFGIVVYEIVAQREPHIELDAKDALILIRDKGLTPTVPENCPQKLVELMQMCWKKDPDHRPTMETIFSMLQ